LGLGLVTLIGLVTCCERIQEEMMMMMIFHHVTHDQGAESRKHTCKLHFIHYSVQFVKNRKYQLVGTTVKIPLQWWISIPTLSKDSAVMTNDALSLLF
jgi:hypothetical protein